MNKKFFNNNFKRKWFPSKNNNNNEAKKSHDERRNNNNQNEDEENGVNLVEKFNSSNNDAITGYTVWNIYINEKFTQSEYEPRIEMFNEFIEWNRDEFNLREIEINNSFDIDFNHLYQFNKNICDLIVDETDVTFRCLGYAMHTFMLNEMKENYSNLNENNYCLPQLHPRLLNYNNITDIKDVGPSFADKLVTIKGNVVKVGPIEHICTALVYECTACQQLMYVKQRNKKYTVSRSCKGSKKCDNKIFKPLKYHRLTSYSPFQIIKIQELQSLYGENDGRLPCTICIELYDELVNKCMLGDIVTVTGTMKLVEPQSSYFNVKQNFNFYIIANNIISLKKTSTSTTFTRNNLLEIKEICDQENVFKLLVSSLNPTIYGYEMIKAGMLLVLLGGTTRYADINRKIPLRGDSHILIVGDPGLGKSQLLKAAANVAPISSYVCGNKTSAAGLTIALTKDKGNQDYNLEGGALLLADGGVCCIDEFDKMKTQHQALLEAMERQTITIAKAGFFCNLSARTSIISAANPSGGRYNRAKTVAENLKISPAILSRFDLVFILIDKPNEEHDNRLSEHVVRLKSGANLMQKPSTIKFSLSQTSDTSMLFKTCENSLLTRLTSKYNDEEEIEEKSKDKRHNVRKILSHEQMKRYISYARQYVHPVIDEEAKSVLSEFYLDLRKKSQSFSSAIITARQIESLIRLTEARARVDLREIANVNDANDVIEILKYSMIDTYTDDKGNLDVTRGVHGSGMSKRGQAKRFIETLIQISDRNRCKTFKYSELKQIAYQCSLDVVDFASFIDNLNNAGYIIKTAANIYKLV